MKHLKLNPEHVALVEIWSNRYRLVGPGDCWIMPWEKVLTTISTTPAGASFALRARTMEENEVEVDVKVLYRIDPGLFYKEMLPRIPLFNKGVWQNVLEWRTRHILRGLLADYSWKGLEKENQRKRVESLLTKTLDGAMRGVAITVSSVLILEMRLSDILQEAIDRDQESVIEEEAQVRAAEIQIRVLEKYRDFFAQTPKHVVEHIFRWGMLKAISENSNLQLFTALNPHLNGTNGDLESTMSQMELNFWESR